MSEERVIDGPIIGHISHPWKLIDLINASPELQQQLKDAGWTPPEADADLAYRIAEDDRLNFFPEEGGS